MSRASGRKRLARRRHSRAVVVSVAGAQVLTPLVRFYEARPRLAPGGWGPDDAPLLPRRRRLLRPGPPFRSGPWPLRDVPTILRQVRSKVPRGPQYRNKAKTVSENPAKGESPNTTSGTTMTGRQRHNDTLAVRDGARAVRFGHFRRAMSIGAVATRRRVPRFQFLRSPFGRDRRGRSRLTACGNAMAWRKGCGEITAALSFCFCGAAD